VVGVLAVPGSAGAGTATTELGDLYSVSCPSDGFCMAVGVRHATRLAPLLGLAYRYDGTAWHAMPVATPHGYDALQLYSVSCASASFCVAIGYAQTSSSYVWMALRWNGTSWRSMTIQRPGRSGGAAVSCVAPGTCMVVGSRYASKPGSASCPNDGCLRPVTWQLSGGVFRLRGAAKRPFPIAQLNGVSCTSGDNCVAVGSETGYRHPLAEHWNGRRWSWMGRMPYPHTKFREPGGSLSDVSCPAPRTCVAGGVYLGSGNSSDNALIENRLAGGAWRDGLPGPEVEDENGGTALWSISCSVYHRCAAVGRSTDRGGGGDSVLAWRDFRTGGFQNEWPAPAFFAGVSCRPSYCIYVGNDVLYEGSIHEGQPVIYRGGRHPTKQVIPAPPAA
jgi:hypothetical protein